MNSAIEQIIAGILPSEDALTDLFANTPQDTVELLCTEARRTADRVYGRRVFIRGLIEFTSWCSQNCLYCGLRRDNTAAERYRLTKDEIIERCEVGRGLGVGTFVLQGGEDPYFDDGRLVDIVRSIRERFPSHAITLSVGERPRESYKKLREAGADRYLLRHETADPDHFALLHPAAQQQAVRLRALADLKDLGYQVGAGFIIGTPYQTPRHLARDIIFLKNFEPDMAGIGPFMPHHATPFADHGRGSLIQTLLSLAIVRLLMPNVLLPSTTALASLVPDGRLLGLDAGANVIMPNLSPERVRGAYSIYDGKRSSGTEAAEEMQRTIEELKSRGYEPDGTRGDRI